MVENGGGRPRQPEAVDFLIGCVEADRSWAEWIAWQVQGAGYGTAFAGWDVVPGNREIDWQRRAVERARHTLLVVSPAIVEAPGALATWDGLLRADPDGARRLLIPVVVRHGELGAFLGGLAPIRLAGLAEPEAAAALHTGLAAVLTGTARPTVPPTFPASGAPSGPAYPGMALAEELADLLTRVIDAYQQTYPDARITRAVSNDGLVYLEVRAEKDGSQQRWPVGVLPGDLDDAALDRFLAQVHDAHKRRIQRGESDLIYGRTLANDAVRRRAQRVGVTAQSIHAVEHGWDPAQYQARQAERLAADADYPADLYVAQRFTELTGPAGAAPRADALSKVLDWLDTRDPRLVLVLADFGHGKTFLTREIARRVPTRYDRLVPMVIDLKTFGTPQTLDTVLKTHLQDAGEEGVPARAVRRILERGQLLLIFDGFDELAVRLTYDVAAEQLRLILSAVSGRAKVILTSRTQHFASNEQLLSALGKQVHLQPAARLIRLEHFDDGQILEFLRRCYARSGDRALAENPDQAASDRFALLKRVTDLRGLSQTPRMLAFISDLPERDLLAARDKEGRITQTDLYRTLVNRWLRFEADRKPPTFGALPSLDPDQLRKAATAIALRRWTADEGLDLPTLQTAVNDTLEDLGKIRLKPAQTLFTIGSGSLLTRDDNDRFSFVHASVMEYLVADGITGQLAATGDSPTLRSHPVSALIVSFLIGARSAQTDLERWVRAQLRDSRPGGATGSWWRRRRADTDRSSSAPSRLNALALASGLGLNGLAPDLHDEDLRGADLTTRGDLRYANLSGADLRGMRLADLALRGAILRRADLRGIELTNVDLTDADLRGADLTGAHLVGPKLRGARLDESRWQRAALLDAELGPAELDHDALRAAAIPGHDPARPMWLPQLRGQPHLAWDDAGDLLAAAWGAHVVLLTARLHPLRVLNAYREVTALALAPDGRTLAIGCSGGATQLVDLGTEPTIRDLAGHSETVSALAFAPNGETLASADRKGNIYRWTVASGRQGQKTESGVAVAAMTYARNGKTLAAAGGNIFGARDYWGPTTAALYLEGPDLGRGARDPGRGAGQILHKAGRISALAISSSGDAVAVGTHGGKVLRFFDVPAKIAEMTPAWEPDLLTSHEPPVLALEFMNDYILGADRVNLIRWSSGDHFYTAPAVRYFPHPVAAAVAPSGGLVAWVNDEGQGTAWEPASAGIVGTFQSTTSAVRTLTFSPDGSVLASADSAGRARLWEAVTGRQVASLDVAHVGVVMEFTADSRVLATSGMTYREPVRIFDAKTGRPAGTIPTNGDVRAMAFSADGGYLAMAHKHGSIKVAATATGQLVIQYAPFEVNAGSATGELLAHSIAVAFTPDGRIVGTGMPSGHEPAPKMRALHIDRATPARRVVPLAHLSDGGFVDVTVISPDARLVAFGGRSGSLRVHDTDSGQLVHSLPSLGGVTCLSFSADGRMLASGHGDYFARLWDVATGREIRALEGHGPVTAVAVAPDGRTMATGHGDGAIRLWDLPSNRLIATLLALSDDNWATLLPDGSYTLDRPTDELWWAVKLSRFSADEISGLDPGIRRRNPGTPIPR
jgi:WD40 repeat protein